MLGISLTSNLWGRLGIAAGAGMNQIFGLQAIYPFVSLLYILSLLVGCRLWLSARTQTPVGDTL
jgi:hypothetical protein